MSAPGGSASAAVPIVDLRAFSSGTPSERERIAADVDAGCQDAGFLIIANHGVPTAVTTAAWQAARQFFDRPLAEKSALVPDTRDGTRGYFPVQRETLSRSRGVPGEADEKEAFSTGPLRDESSTAGAFFAGENRWPDKPAGFRDAWTDYYRAMEGLATDVMSLFAVALDLPADYFQAYFDRHESALRALNYPEISANASRGQRAGAHSDYGSLTILKSDPVVPGLEIETADGQWRPVRCNPDNFVVNIGDLMARWTNDRWTSTVHRVTGSGPRRQSIAFFQNPNADAEIRCLPGCCDDSRPARYGPVTAGRYLKDRFTAAIG